MQKDIKIKTKDNHIIYGILNCKEKNSKLIIFVHGLSGQKDEHQFYNAAEYFTNNGFTTFRFDLYSWEKKARKLTECSIKTHSTDLNTVVNYFSKKFSEIYFVGHSFGGPTIMLADLSKIKSIVLWDPSLNFLKEDANDLQFNEALGLYILNCGIEILLSKRMVEEWKSIKPELIKNLTKPVKIICAGRENLRKIYKKNMHLIPAENKLVIIKNADHHFSKEGTEKQLFNETLKWFRK